MPEMVRAVYQLRGDSSLAKTGLLAHDEEEDEEVSN